MVVAATIACNLGVAYYFWNSRFRLVIVLCAVAAVLVMFWLTVSQGYFLEIDDVRVAAGFAALAFIPVLLTASGLAALEGSKKHLPD